MQAVTVDMHVEFEVEPHRLGDGLPPRHPLPVDRDIAKRHNIFAERPGAGNTVTLGGEDVFDGQRADWVF